MQKKILKLQSLKNDINSCGLPQFEALRSRTSLIERQPSPRCTSFFVEETYRPSLRVVCNKSLPWSFSS